MADLNEDIALLNSVDDVKVDPLEEKVEKIPEEVTKETQEEEETPKEEVEEVEEKEAKDTLAPHERPTVAQLKKEFPELFKKFPFLRDIYWREQQYTEVFPTLSDAKEAAENNEAFSSIRDDIYQGDGTKFLNALKEADGLEKFSKNILNSLYKVSPEAQWTAITPILENVIKSFYRSSKDDNIKNAALHLSEFLFGTSEVAEGKKTFVKEVPEEKTDNKERERWENERYNSFNVDTLSGIHDSLVGVIKTGIDPDGVLSNFMKDAIVNKTIEEIKSQLENDNSHMSYMRTLWSKAKKNGYSSADKSSITTAFLARAKAMVPSIRRKLLAEALGTSAKINEKKRETVESGQNRREPNASGNSPASGQLKTLNPKQVDWSKTSDLDILNGNATLKK